MLPTILQHSAEIIACIHYSILHFTDAVFSA